MDPFIDAQDWDISAVDIAVRDTGAEKVSAKVSFKNLGKPTTVVLDLVKLRGEWRIADINWAASKPCAHFSSSAEGADDVTIRQGCLFLEQTNHRHSNALLPTKI